MGAGVVAEAETVAGSGAALAKGADSSRAYQLSRAQSFTQFLRAALAWQRAIKIS